MSTSTPSTAAEVSGPGQEIPVANEKLSPFEQRKRKKDSKWKQQNLCAIRLNVTLLHLFIGFITTGIIFIGLGCLTYFFSSKYPPVIRREYTNCVDSRTNLLCSATASSKTSMCSCEKQIEIDNDALTDGSNKVLLFYELTNFYQNTRAYRKDVDEYQINGNAIQGQGTDAIEPSERSCKNYYRKGVTSGKFIYPCGKIANSYFSDEFLLTNRLSGTSLIPNSNGIAWQSDISRFQKPKQLGDWNDITNFFELPKDWHEEQKLSFRQNNGIENQRFIAWMRTAAFKTFRKKYGYINGLQKGNYTIVISYRYDSKAYGGRKSFVIAAENQFISDNFFFYAYIATGAICLLLGPLIYLIQFVLKSAHKRRTASNNKDSNGQARSNTTVVTVPAEGRAPKIKSNLDVQLQ